MRLGTLAKLLAVGSIAALAYRYQRARRARDERARWDDFSRDLAEELDPNDPVQGFDEIIELSVEPLDVDALSVEDYEAAQDLAGLASAIDATDFADDDLVAVPSVVPTRPAIVVEDRAGRLDAGDLYGGHTPRAVDRAHPDNDAAFEEGQNWIEALETSAIENGAEPERSLDDIIDDDEVLRAPHPSDARDRPVADFGSGGRRGL